MIRITQPRWAHRYGDKSAPCTASDEQADDGEMPTARTDENQADYLCRQVRQALQATGYLAFQAVDIRVEGSEVSLIGQVPTFFMKQIAQQAAMSVPGVERVHNDLRVP